MRTTPLEWLDLGVRTYNRLTRYGFETVEDLQRTSDDFSRRLILDLLCWKRFTAHFPSI